jgi:hypothetical protein
MQLSNKNPNKSERKAERGKDGVTTMRDDSSGTPNNQLGVETVDFHLPANSTWGKQRRHGDKQGEEILLNPSKVYGVNRWA